MGKDPLVYKTNLINSDSFSTASLFTCAVSIILSERVSSGHKKKKKKKCGAVNKETFLCTSQLCDIQEINEMNLCAQCMFHERDV